MPRGWEMSPWLQTCISILNHWVIHLNRCNQYTCGLKDSYIKSALIIVNNALETAPFISGDYEHIFAHITVYAQDSECAFCPLWYVT